MFATVAVGWITCKIIGGAAGSFPPTWSSPKYEFQPIGVSLEAGEKDERI